MKIDKQSFLDSPKKAVTLIGMSGAGKTHISCQLDKWGWNNYSCDYEIGAKYLKAELDTFASDQEMSAENISALMEYLGRLGNPDLGGCSLDLFKQRQKAYYDAELTALDVMGEAMAKTDAPFVHDSTGSIVEIEEEDVISRVGEKTMFVYLKTGEEEEKEVLQRARDYPKPLFFPKSFLDEKIDLYMKEANLGSVDEFIPDEFSRWVFPLLFEARKPKYQRLADLYGVTISAAKFKNLESSEQFISIIADHLDNE